VLEITTYPRPTMLPIYLIFTQTILHLCLLPTSHLHRPHLKKCKTKATPTKISNTSDQFRKEHSIGVKDLATFNTDTRTFKLQKKIKFCKQFTNSIPIIQILQVIKSSSNPEYNLKMISFLKCQQFELVRRNSSEIGSIIYMF
jgi:hypothetical protein